MEYVFRIVVDKDASIHTAKNIYHRASIPKLGIGHFRYALVNILIESDYMFNRRILVTIDTVSNIISSVLLVV